VRYETAGAFRAALEQRLKDDAAAGGPSVQRARKRVAFERLLARLQVAAPDRWLLKGGFALELRLAERARTTMDIDLDWRVSEQEAAAALVDAAATDLEDFFDFQVERTVAAPGVGGAGLRYRATAVVAGRTFEQLIVDVGIVGDPVMTPERIETSEALAFAGIDRVRVPAAPLEQHLAEKLHAYSRTYAGDQPSSRPKDLIDMVLIADLARFDAARLCAVIEAVFSTRATHPVPEGLSKPPASWQAPYRALALEVGLEPELALGFGAARSFVDPVLRSPPVRGSWDPVARRWQ
jgi:predicted nucleotidyltransferase component of viral defense system